MDFFLTDVGWDYHGWDFGEPTEGPGSGYSVCARTPTYEQVASSFEEFMMKYALGGGYERYQYGQQDATGEWPESGPIHCQQASVRVD